jgi:Spy/CpxP family protein refolding chaperone
MKRAIIASIMLAGAMTAANPAPRNADPDWPCQQIKVGELSVASFWNGPPIDPASVDWRKDEAVASLVGAVTQRRLPMDAAVERINAFAKTVAEDKGRTLGLVFAGVFDVLNREREKVVDGLDRFGKRQKTLADGLRQDGEAVRAALAANPPDEAKVADLTQKLTWDQQFFESRRQSLRFACDLPTTIEQRLYGLSQAIQAHLE